MASPHRRIAVAAVAMVAVLLFLQAPPRLRGAPDHSGKLIEAGPVNVEKGQQQSWDFTAPAIPAGAVPALELEARAWGEKLSPGSSGFFMELFLNDEPVKAAEHRLHMHLRNKPQEAPGSRPWFLWRGGWRVMTAPDFEEKHKGIYGPEAYRFLIEVPHLLKPGQNTLTVRDPVRNTAQTLTVRNIRLVLLEHQPKSEGLVVAAKNPPVLEVAPDGAISVRSGEHAFHVSSSFSVPGGGWLRLGPAIAPREGEKAVRATITPKAESVDVSFDGGAYAVERSIRVGSGRVWVHDRVTNHGKSDLGMMIRHELGLPRSEAAVVHLTGDEDPALGDVSDPANPTLFLPLGGLSLGLVAEDDIFRRQAIFGYHTRPTVASLRTERLAIPAGQSASLQWSVYALPGGDYFDFINRVRADWKVKVHLEGPYWWSLLATAARTSDAQLQAWYKRSPVTAAVLGNWEIKENGEKLNTLAFGVGVLDPLFAEYRERCTKVTERVHHLMPGVKVLIYQDVWFNWPEPQPSEFEDSWIVLKDGKRYSELWRGQYKPSPGIFPTATNRYGKAFRNMLTQVRRDVGVDGFYFDDSNGPGVLKDPITYNSWDGCSAILDPKIFAIQHKVGYLSLLANDYHRKLFDELKAEGVPLLANFEPYSFSFNRDTWPRFSESDNVKNTFTTHLYAPIAFSYHFEAYTVKELRDRLDVGALYCVTGPGDKLGIVNKFFPITPTALHAGWIEGEERIVTDRSGKYGWDKQNYRARLWRYRADGTPVEADPPWQELQGLVAVEVPERGIAILER